MATQSDPCWAVLLDSLGEEPSELAFRAVASILDTWPGPDASAALSFAGERLDSWPDDVRVAPWTWCCAAASRARPASLMLARTVRNRSNQCGCEPIPLSEFCNHPFVRSLTRLEIEPRYPVRSFGPLIEKPERWSALRHLVARTGTEDHDDSRALVRSPLINHLESLHFDLSRSGQSAGQRLNLQGDQLLRLAVESGINDRLIGLIKSSRLPRLRAEPDARRLRCARW